MRKRPGVLRVILRSKMSLHLIGTTEVEIFSDHMLEECAPRHGAIEHLCQREFGLQNGDVVTEVGRAIARQKRRMGT